MTNQKPKNDNKGFTIIEVMIVLVIAAIILLIVFLAVPALQRNSRNNQRKNDASRLVTAAKEYKSNNNSQNPPNTNAVTALTGTLGFYGATNIILADGNNLPSGDTSVAAPNPAAYLVDSNAYVFVNAQCKNNGQAISRGNDIVGVFYNETSGTAVGQCI